ncbi:MAG TPA: twin-arginine translocase TatA/TatE family subunit [Pyrinomonadaceae bacterium]|jgi:TatA/E family protein of Tat protein translocase|nr:twin-arginine translocase TatA/TatE family subunit [Pyrinomonadaceae bacterium]
MPHVLIILEFLGTTELMVIALVALIIFGPRKLPEIGRTVGKSIAEFKRASDDFKRTWEYEVELEQRKPALDVPRATTEQEVAAAAPSTLTASSVTAEDSAARASDYNLGGEPVARNSFDPWADEPAATDTAERADGEEEDEINAS